MVTTNTCTVAEMHAFLAEVVKAGEGHLPLVICGPASYGTEVTLPSKVAFRSVYDEEADTWVRQHTVAYDLFNEDAPSPFSFGEDG
jgi:hypothetical protein